MIMMAGGKRHLTINWILDRIMHTPDIDVVPLFDAFHKCSFHTFKRNDDDLKSYFPYTLKIITLPTSPCV